MFNLDNTITSHPSMFQTPLAAKVTADQNPDGLWIDQFKRAVPCRESPAMNSRTRCTLINSFNSTNEKPINNAKPNLLFALFFSPENVNLLQKSIRASVYRWSGIRIGNQSDTDLRQAMHNAFVRFARHIDERELAAAVVLNYLRSEVARLDDIVVDMSIRVIINHLDALKGYIQFTTAPATLDRPMDTKITGTKTYRAPTDVLFGSNT